jgi:hypothetical protein
MTGRAEMSACGAYRYALWRTWAADQPQVLFIGLNPSMADALADDPTLRRCIRFAQQWGYGGVILANLFAFRARSPKMLSDVADPIGPENDRWLEQLRNSVDLAVAAWGRMGRLHSRAARVEGRLGELYCLGSTKNGAPRHPLYVRGDSALQPWCARPI